jgi:hypothetical protein
MMVEKTLVVVILVKFEGGAGVGGGRRGGVGEDKGSRGRGLG